MESDKNKSDDDKSKKIFIKKRGRDNITEDSIEKPINKPRRQIVIDDEMSDDNKLYLNSATKFSQYLFPINDGVNRKITLISELHEYSWECKNPSITIDKYCKNVVDKYCKHKLSNCKIMLEYNRTQDPLTIGSEAIRSTYKTLKKQGMENVIVPFDFRVFFLSEKHNELYTTDDITKFYKEDLLGGIIQNYVLPYLSHKFAKLRPYESNIFDIRKDMYAKEVSEYLLNYYIPDITKHFIYILCILFKNYDAKTKKFPKENDKYEFTVSLKNAWKKVSDFFILRELLLKDNTQHIVLVCGEYHYDNINYVIQNFSFIKKITEKEGNKNDCIKITL